MINHQKSKKATGSFYTPTYVVDFMVDRVFHYLSLENKVIFTSFRYFKKSLGKLSFCDPSLGNGNFIIGVLKRVSNELKKFTTIKQKEKSEFFRKFFEFNVYGIELNSKALDECKERISFFFPILKSCSFSNLKIGNSIVNKDSSQILTPEEAAQLNFFDWKEEFHPRTSFDVIIGNPPYYNLKKMGLLDDDAKILFQYLKQSKTWEKYHRSSSDIYYYFIFQALNHLSPEGLLSFIIPDYWIENKYADILREYILQNQILEILDLSNLRIFKDNGKWLNVTNCITLIQNRYPVNTIKIAKNVPKVILENHHKEKKAIDNFFFEIEQTNLRKEKWVLSPHLPFLKKLEDSSRCTNLGNLAKIIQGVSPGVKEIFVVSRSKAEKLALEKDVLVPFITNSNVRKWVVDNDNSKLAILPSKITNLEDFANTRAYLEQNYELLIRGSDRQRLLKSNKIRWFDFSVYRNLETFSKYNTKIMVPYRSLSPRFGLDENGSFGATDIYAIIPKKKNDIYFLLGILNSDIVHFWYSEAGKRKGKMLEFFSDPLKRIPIPKTDEKKILTDLVKEMVRINKNTINQDEEASEIGKDINHEVARLYGVDYNFLKSKLDSKKH
ncbi:MAG: N-6 DNA methylase [Candidatus Heimdallarchaeota archaeon]|nr:N-6 DNA methylase [Candidatus Heimdallarchaeota archaeon]